jgi:hypothetical protein
LSQRERRSLCRSRSKLREQRCISLFILHPGDAYDIFQLKQL